MFRFYLCFYYQLDQASGVCYSVQDCANINTVWASLIVEEFSRLGLTVRPSFSLFVLSFWHMNLINFIIVFLSSSRVEIITPRRCCFHSSTYYMYPVFWWALTCISCCWLCQRISQASGSHNVIRNCSFKSSSCCEFF